MKIFFLIAFTSLWSLTTYAAEEEFSDAGIAEPVDKNTSGLFLDANLEFGQALAVGGSTPKSAWFLSAGPGYGIAKGTWSRLEVSLSLGSGYLAFKRTGGQKESVEMPIDLFALARLGYGYSLGSHVFAVWRIGFGPAMGKYKQKISGFSFTSPDTTTGFMGTAGMDIVMPAGDLLDFIGGIQFRYMSFAVDDFQVGGETVEVDAFQANVPTFNVGLRVKF